jgi:hypothetical protein
MSTRTCRLRRAGTRAVQISPAVVCLPAAMGLKTHLKIEVTFLPDGPADPLAPGLPVTPVAPGAPGAPEAPGAEAPGGAESMPVPLSPMKLIPELDALVMSSSEASSSTAAIGVNPTVTSQEQPAATCWPEQPSSSVTVTGWGFTPP